MAMESKLSQTEHIVEHLGQISQHLSELNSSAVIDGLLLVFIGAFSAFIFNLLYWRIVKQHSRLSKAADSLTKIILELEAIAVSYWLEDAVEIDIKDREFQEIKIKTLNRLMIKSAENFKKTIKDKNKEKKITELSNFQNEIFDLSTGADFESLGRTKNSHTASRIAFECTDFRLFLEKNSF